MKSLIYFFNDFTHTGSQVDNCLACGMTSSRIIPKSVYLQKRIAFEVYDSFMSRMLAGLS